MAGAAAPSQPVDLYPSTSLSAELKAAAPNFRSASLQSVAPRDSVFSYSYVEVGAVQQDPDDLGDDVEAVYAKVSLELFEIFHIFAGCATRDTDFQNTDSNLAELGGGLELNGGARHIDLDNDVASDGDGTTGWEAGARVHFARIFSIGATYQKFDEFDALAGSLRLSF